MKLTEHAIPPQKTGEGDAPCLVIFFHGYGSTGAGLASGLPQILPEGLKDAKIICPDGPVMCWQDDKGNHGFSWFAVEDMLDAPDGAKAAERASAAAPAINAWLDEVLAREGVDESRVVIAGFSQGASMAYFAALLRDKPVAGVFSLSGGGLEHIGPPASRPPVALLAGERETGHYSGAPVAMKTQVFLDRQGFRTDCVILPDQGHEITPAALEMLARLKDIVVPAAPASDAKKPSGPVPPRDNPRPPGFHPG
ncbi:MAG: hypothetical protein GC185_00085 [Alphaproteobacteria bacterium]|nr:hypothetical protein [Alphaproteobacteria bacterium]